MFDIESRRLKHFCFSLFYSSYKYILCSSLCPQAHHFNFYQFKMDEPSNEAKRHARRTKIEYHTRRKMIPANEFRKKMNYVIDFSVCFFFKIFVILIWKKINFQLTLNELLSLYFYLFWDLSDLNWFCITHLAKVDRSKFSHRILTWKWINLVGKEEEGKKIISGMKVWVFWSRFEKLIEPFNCKKIQKSCSLECELRRSHHDFGNVHSLDFWFMSKI